MYKMIAMDMDDTLLNDEKVITSGNRNALHRLINAGIVVSLCSGRGAVSMKPYIDSLDLVHPQIGCTGNIVIETDGSFHVEKYYGESYYQELIQLLRPLKCEFTVSTEEGIYYEYAPSWLNHLKMYEGVIPVTEMDLTQVKKAYKISIAYLEAQTLQAIRRLPIDQEDVFISAKYIDIMPKGANKFTGIQSVAARYGIADEQIVTMGDHHNDLAMLRQAGLGCAMKNAQPEAMTAAKITLPVTNNEDAVDYVARTYFGV